MREKGRESVGYVGWGRGREVRRCCKYRIRGNGEGGRREGRGKLGKDGEGEQ